MKKRFPINCNAPLRFQLITIEGEINDTYTLQEILHLTMSLPNIILLPRRFGTRAIVLSYKNPKIFDILSNDNFTWNLEVDFLNIRQSNVIEPSYARGHERDIQ